MMQKWIPFTSTDLPQRTYSQRFGNPALDEGQDGLVCDASRKALRLTNRPFLGHGGLNDASGLLHRGRCFTQTNTESMERIMQAGNFPNASLRDKVEILAKNPYRFFTSTPTFGRFAGLRGSRSCPSSWPKQKLRRILKCVHAFSKLKRPSPWPKSSRHERPRNPHGGMKGLYAMLALTGASLVDDDVDTTPVRAKKRQDHEDEGQVTIHMRTRLGGGVRIWPRHQVALSNHRHRVQIHSRRRPLPLPYMDAGGTGRGVHAPPSSEALPSSLPCLRPHRGYPSARGTRR